MSSPPFHVQEERQRDESHQCSMTRGAKPEVSASDFSRQLPVLYSFIVLGGFCGFDLQIMKV